jgi:hypothetical protein
VLKILFTYPEALPHETLLLQNLMQDEWDFLHVRKPDYSKEEMINFLEMIPQFHHKVVLHTHYELIREFELAGINLNKRAMSRLTAADELTSACDIRELTLNGKEILVYGTRPDLVTFSAHSYSEIQQLPFKTDYVFLSPIFHSISKAVYHPAFEDENILSAFLADTPRKIIALGAVNMERIATCKRLGFDGYAMLGDIWKKYFTFVETIQ